MAMRANNDTQATENGYMVLAADKSDKNSRIYIAWVPSDGSGITRLLTRLRKQSDQIGMLGICRGTLLEVVDAKRDLCASWTGTGDWFFRTPDIDAVLHTICNHNIDRLNDERDEVSSERATIEAPGPKSRKRGVKSSGRNMPA